MDQTLKTKWLAALRSGHFKQTTGALKTVDTTTGETRYCCLGVLCEIAGLQQIEPSSKRDTYFITFRDQFDSEDMDEMYASSECLPMSFAERLKMPAEDPENVMVMYDGAPITLAELNDTYGLNFNQLANIIEAQL